jgi:histidinol dehydrogenase
VTTSRRLAGDVRRELEIQARALPRRAAIGRVLRDGALIVIVPHLDAGVELCNRFAPEHLELLVSRPRRLLPSVRAAGAVFLGHYTPESAGDYVAGPSHVLPTGGTAAMFSGLTVDDFRRRTSVIEFTRADLKASHRALRTLAATEGLEAHARSADLRLAGRTGGA